MRTPRIARTTTFVVLLGLSIAVGCGGNSKQSDEGAPTTSDSDDGAFKQGGTLVRRIAADCKTLNWVLTTTVYEDRVMRYLYEPLVGYDEKLEYTPVLARDYEVSNDRLRITVHLRDDMHWHDGVPSTPREVKFTLTKIQDPAVPGPNKSGYFNKLDRLEVVDNHTVVFHWKEPYAPSVYALTQLWPIPEHIYGEGDFLRNPANRNPVGCGPFKFEEWRTAQYISLVRYDDYHGRKAYLDRVIFKVIEDDAVALNALKAGEIDEMRVTQIQWERQTADDDFVRRFNKYVYYIPQYNYIGWNCRSVWFKDPRVRKAMTMLCDRESSNATIYTGYAKLLSGQVYSNSRTDARVV